MKLGLKTLGIAIALAAAAQVIDTTEARSEAEYPWCAISSMSMGTQTCSFATLDQCRAYVAPMGFCQPNARYAGHQPKR